MGVTVYQHKNLIMLRFIFILIFYLIYNISFGQCIIWGKRRSGFVQCKLSDVLQLQGDVQGNYLKYYWKPASGLSNPNVLDPIVIAGPANIDLNLSQMGLSTQPIWLQTAIWRWLPGIFASHLRWTTFWPGSPGSRYDAQCLQPSLESWWPHQWFRESITQMVLPAGDAAGVKLCRWPGNMYQFFFAHVFPVALVVVFNWSRWNKYRQCNCHPLCILEKLKIVS